MTDFDILIVAVYLITVFYVLYRAYSSLEDQQVTVKLDQGLLNSQLEEQELKDILEIQFKLKGIYQFEPIQKLPLQITNKSANYSMYVDWDHSSLSDFGKRSRRVIRLTSGNIIDLSRPQVFSLIAPGQTLVEEVVAEDMLRPKLGLEGLEIASPLIDLSPLKSESRQKEFQFSLRLVLRCFDLSTNMGQQTYVILCRFIAKKLPWTVTIFK